MINITKPNNLERRNARERSEGIDMKKVDVLGVVKLSWNLTLVLPLAKAHQLQMLLTEALLYEESGYADREKFAFTQCYEPPPVEVMSPSRPLFDATMLTSDDAKSWRDVVRTGLEADKEANAMDVVSPELWVGMR